jgi:hypothetical protein
MMDRWLAGKREGGGGTYAMKNPISMAEFESPERHGHPAFYVCGKEDK